MAYTTFQKTFWSDDYTLKLNTTQKTVYIYIITNEKTTQCGIYELPIIKATTELGLSAEEFLLHLKKFNDDKKIQYSLETQEVAVINWLKHNDNLSWKSKEKVRKELINVKNPNLVVLLYDPRQPLYDGNRKKKVDGKFIEEIYVIDNPWKEVFASLTDEMLTEIRKPYIKSIALMPLTSPFNAPSMGDKAYTNTNSLQIHNITNSIQKQNTETVNHMEHEKPKPNYQEYKPKPNYENMPEQEPVRKLDKLITQGIKHWNSKENLPVCEYTVLTLPNDKMPEISNKFDVFRKGQILNAIDNLSKAYDTIEQTYRPKNFQNFIVNSLDNWFEERSVEPAKRNYRTAEERRFFTDVIRIGKDDPDWVEEKKQECIDSLNAIGEEFIDYEKE